MHPEDYSQQIAAYWFACFWLASFLLCATLFWIYCLIKKEKIDAGIFIVYLFYLAIFLITVLR